MTKWLLLLLAMLCPVAGVLSAAETWYDLGGGAYEVDASNYLIQYHFVSNGDGSYKVWEAGTYTVGSTQYVFQDNYAVVGFTSDTSHAPYYYVNPDTSTLVNATQSDARAKITEHFSNWSGTGDAATPAGFFAGAQVSGGTTGGSTSGTTTGSGTGGTTGGSGGGGVVVVDATQFDSVVMILKAICLGVGFLCGQLAWKLLRDSVKEKEIW